jgi:hypothetical protein
MMTGSKKLPQLVRERQFINIATCDNESHPNAAPKYILKLDNNFLYLVDYTRGRTYENLKINDEVSLPLIDNDTLIGYQVNGAAKILERGVEYGKLKKELTEKITRCSVDRIIAGVKSEHAHQGIEIVFPDDVAIIKITIKEFVEIGPAGTIVREKI